MPGFPPDTRPFGRRGQAKVGQMPKNAVSRRLLTVVLAISLVAGGATVAVAHVAGHGKAVVETQKPADDHHHVLTCPECTDVCLCVVTCGPAIANTSAAVAAPPPDRGIHPADPRAAGISPGYRHPARGPPPFVPHSA